MSALVAPFGHQKRPAPSGSQEKKPLKPCCACPETKKARDASHKECMRALGFKI
ncbi:hypothetical protein FD754_012534 [Muntiacus muntjak]|uniref:Cytochrome c oxidase copper chaperone n=1 Tax=Muntiacus muntjak TaxID=9888 RepID=A0A5N3VED4_MUNMU|nr:hypothetical protein FD754_012534 [Muntiacus muntjak]